MVGKSQIVDAIAARGATRAAAAAAVDAVLGEITAALAAGERVTLTGFGTFEAVARPERTARNPRTGATLTVAATTVARFHPGAGLRDAVASGNGGDRPAVHLPVIAGAATGDATPPAETPVVAEAVAPAPVTASGKHGKKSAAASASSKAKGGKPTASAKDEAKAARAAAAAKSSSKGKAAKGSDKSSKDKDKDKGKGKSSKGKKK